MAQSLKTLVASLRAATRSRPPERAQFDVQAVERKLYDEIYGPRTGLVEKVPGPAKRVRDARSPRRRQRTRTRRRDGG